MSEKSRPIDDPKEIANHPAVQEVLAQIEAMTGMKVHIDGAGTPEQEEEHRVYLAEQAVERRKEEEQFARDHAVTPEVLAKIFACLPKN